MIKSSIAYLLIAICSATALFSQEITEENFVKADQQIWERYEQDLDVILELMKENPEKKDSLSAIWNQLNDNVAIENCNNAIKYAAVPGGLQRLFWVRLHLSKDTLGTILATLPAHMQQSEYGKSLLLHVNTRQIEEGDHFFNFQALDSQGDIFQLSSLTSENILLIYGGLDCMGKSRRDYLVKLYEETNREKFQMVVYWICSDLEQLKALKAKYPVDYHFVSDFLDDHSPVKITYGAQTTPTCFLIDKNRNVIIKTQGLPQAVLTRMKEENKL
jgi:hypothetical protein